MTIAQFRTTNSLIDVITDIPEPVPGYLVVRPDGSHEFAPIESDRFRVIAEGAWRRLIDSGANLYRTCAPDHPTPTHWTRLDHVGETYLLWYLVDGVLSHDLINHHLAELQQRNAEEARKAIEVAA